MWFARPARWMSAWTACAGATSYTNVKSSENLTFWEQIHEAGRGGADANHTRLRRGG